MGSRKHAHTHTSLVRKCARERAGWLALVFFPHNLLTPSRSPYFFTFDANPTLLPFLSQLQAETKRNELRALILEHQKLVNDIQRLELFKQHGEVTV